MNHTTHSAYPAALATATHTLLRVGAGLLFIQHGARKLFGWFGGEPVELASQMGVAGVLEFFGGILIVIGLLTRPVGVLLAGLMLSAYFIAHAPQGGFPIENGGNLALLFMFVWIYFAGNGAGPWSVDARLRSRWL